ncbi:MAG: RNA polymerase sigma factor [Candidatus Acidiferrales bacterium]
MTARRAAGYSPGGFVLLRQSLRNPQVRPGNCQTIARLRRVPLVQSDHANVSQGSRPELAALDERLMRQVAAGNETAFAEIYDRYSGLVFSVASRVLRDAGAAEEVLQDVFYQLWRKAADFNPARGSLAGWLLVAARNRAISRLRRREPTAGEELFEADAMMPPSLESGAMQQQLMRRVRRAMEGLPVTQRVAIELAYFEGMTHSEIAEKTGEPLGTVKTRLRSAMETLKQAMQV